MNAAVVPIALFRLGRVLATGNALERLTPEEILWGIRRHQAGDWGELTEPDWQANDRALTEGARLLSVYRAANGTRFYLVTESDRRTTTALLPEDY